LFAFCISAKCISIPVFYQQKTIEQQAGSKYEHNSFNSTKQNIIFLTNELILNKIHIYTGIIITRLKEE